METNRWNEGDPVADCCKGATVRSGCRAWVLMETLLQCSDHQTSAWRQTGTLTVDVTLFIPKAGFCLQWGESRTETTWWYDRRDWTSPRSGWESALKMEPAVLCSCLTHRDSGLSRGSAVSPLDFWYSAGCWSSCCVTFVHNLWTLRIISGNIMLILH